MRIFLVGFMGCGKTTLGGKLASRLGVEFIDLDHVLEQRSGMAIAQYFEKFGEAAFRKFERELIAESAFPENAVISTGGGAPCFFDNMELMNKNGVTVYISMPPEALAARLENGKNERPLLKDLSREELVDFIADKLKEREPFYSKAQYTLNGINITPQKVIDILNNHLK